MTAAEGRTPQERDRAAKLQALDAALTRGIADGEAGRVTPVGKAFEQPRAELGFGDK